MLAGAAGNGEVPASLVESGNCPLGSPESAVIRIRQAIVKMGGESYDGPALTEADVLRCVPGVRALLLRLTRNLETTNDLAQETVIAVILAVREGRVREPGALAAYVYQVARNKVATLSSRPSLALVEELPEASVWGERPLTPLEHFEAGELRELALAVLGELGNERDRALITGYYIEGLSKPELMQRMMLNADQFDRVISRARGRMRERLLAKMNGQPAAMRGSAPSGHSFPKDQKAL